MTRGHVDVSRDVTAVRVGGYVGGGGGVCVWMGVCVDRWAGGYGCVGVEGWVHVVRCVGWLGVWVWMGVDGCVCGCVCVGRCGWVCMCGWVGGWVRMGGWVGKQTKWQMDDQVGLQGSCVARGR